MFLKTNIFGDAMFHNAHKKSPIRDQHQKKNSVQGQAQRNTEQDTNNLNPTTKTINKKENKIMNSPQTKDNQSQTTQNENRVDIPGNNFNRPGQAGAQNSRSAYPGAYPGAAGAAASNTPAYAPQPASSSEADGRKLVIGQGISLSGEIEACDHLIVEGTVEAALKGANNMEISETGAFYGAVEIEEATIAGRFEGDLTVRGRLTVQSTGSIVGSISYKELAIEAGAMIEGSVTPLDSQNAGSKNKKSGSKVKSKVRQDNSAELPFSEKVAS